MRLNRICFVLVLLLALGGKAFAQGGSTGTILGLVSDSTGAVIPNAKVTITNTATGTATTVVSTAAGDFTVPNLIPGVYQATAEAAGFSKQVVHAITLVVAQSARINLVLKPGAASEVIEVNATAVELDTDNAAISQLVSEKQVEDLPLNGRNFMDLLFIGSGAVENGSEQGTMRAGKGEGISIDGSRPESNSYLLDGILNTDQALNTPSVVLSVDAIEQFKVLSETYSAQYGLGANQISVVSKSGTNSLHGSVFEFNRNDAFDAKNYFQGTSANPKLRQNQFGFVADGPVWLPKIYNGKDKSFWMANYEGWRITQGLAASFLNVPTTDNLAGNFATAVIDPETGEPFAGGNGFTSIIPAARFSRLAKVTIGLPGVIPAPNCTSGCQGYNYRVASSQTLTTNQQTYRVDQNLGKYGRLFGRGTYAKYISSTINSPSGAVGANNFQEVDANWAVGHTISIGEHIVNQFTLGNLDAFSVQYGGSVSQATQDSLGFTGVFTDQSALQRNYATVSFANSNGEALGNFGAAGNAYTYSDNPMWQYSDALTYIHGAHTLTIGADYKKWSLYRDLADNFLGQYTFADSRATGNQVADFLLGTYSGASAFVPGPFSVAGKAGNLHNYQFSYFAGYLQDDWKVDSKLTLNLGLRWDLRPVPTEAANHMGWLDSSNPLGGMCIADQKLTTDGIAPAGNGFYRYCGTNHPGKSELSDFAPRVGGAYRINSKTVARAGFGVFWDGVEGREIDDSGDIYPYVSRQNLSQNGGQVSYASTDSLWPALDTVSPITGGPSGPNSFIAVIISDKPKNPYVEQWSLSLEREFTPGTTLEINYVGNLGNRLLARQNINQALPMSDPTACSVTPTPAQCTAVARRPYQNFSTYLNSSWIGYSNYNGLNLKFEHRAKDLAITTVYTFAKSLDSKSTAAGAGSEAAGWQGFLNNHNPAADYGRSDFNVGQRFVTSFLYDLPFGHGKKFVNTSSKVLDEVVGGWEATGIVTFQQGFPLTIQANDKLGLLDSFGVNRADQVGSPKNLKWSTTTKYIASNAALFADPSVNTFGNSARNIANMPGIENFNLGFYKNFTFTERAKFQMRFESFNTFNHAQFNPDPSTPAFAGGGSTVQNNVDSSNFGQITAAAPGRILQISGKFSF